jgi:hypothetical protein
MSEEIISTGDLALIKSKLERAVLIAEQWKAEATALQRQNAKLLELIQVPLDMLGTTWSDDYERVMRWRVKAAAIVAEMKAHE